MKGAEMEEPHYRWKKVKKIKTTEGKNFVVVYYRAIKTFYLPNGEYEGEHDYAYKMNPGDIACFVVKHDAIEATIGYLNQMIQLGYIEIQEDKNIVWEDEDENYTK